MVAADDELQISFQDMDTVIDFIKELGYDVAFYYWEMTSELVSYDGIETTVVDKNYSWDYSPQGPFTIMVSDRRDGTSLEYSDSGYSASLSASDLIRRILSGGIERLSAINQIHRDVKEEKVRSPFPLPDTPQ